jgi:hypothetical protein
MSRTDNFMGLSKRAMAMVAYAKRSFSGEIVEGDYGNTHPLSRYEMPDGRVLKEFVRHVECHGGPCYFMALKDVRGCTVRKSKWTRAEINDNLGFSQE